MAQRSSIGRSEGMSDVDFRSEACESLSKLIQYGQSSQVQLASLSRNVHCLQSGVRVSCLEPAAVEQIRSLLDLSNKAITKVRESRVLEALRFELMDERYHSVKE